MPSQTDRIPFNDLGRSSPEVLARINEAVARVISSGWYVLGPEHDAFEAELGAYLDDSRVVLVGNGTDALEIALSTLGVGAGDTVLTVANAGAYSTIAIRQLGATPVYYDVSPETLQGTRASFNAALAALPTSPRAVVVTHLFGAMADVTGIAEAARAHGIPVLEDCAQSLGARLDGRQSGTVGDIATTSFYPTKNLGALGDGGAIFTKDAGLADLAKRTRQYGWASKYHIEFDHGRNSRLDEMQAAILRVKLPLLDGWNARRREIHERYVDASSDGLRFVSETTESFTAHLAAVVTEDREAARGRFADEGVATDVHYPVPDHRQAFPSHPSQGVSLPVTERAAETVFSLPLFPELTDGEVDRVVGAIQKIGAHT